MAEARPPTSRLGELLVRERLITQEQLNRARVSGDRLEAALDKLGILKEEQLAQFLSRKYGVPSVDLTKFQIDPEIAHLLTKELCERHTCVPINRQGSTLIVAMADPSSLMAIDDIKFATHYNVEAVVSTGAAIKATIEKFFAPEATAESTVESMGEIDLDSIEAVEEGPDANARDLERAGEDAPIVKLVNQVLNEGFRRGASDIHFEPYEKFYRIRVRVDGVLAELMRPPLKVRDALASRIKIMSKLNIAERRLPQDGRIRLKMGKAQEAVDFRVSILPTLFGEKVVLRLMTKAGLQKKLDELGFEDQQLKDFKEAVKSPYGMILVTGPSGSGKTTTLYSALQEVNDPTMNLSTAEDPVEYNLQGINQVSTREEVGLTFASALRSFLRQDPDIIMVGEIRDFETAETAIKAALTGHLVLSTLHTNDAPSTVTRLLNMGIEPFLVASSVLLISAQRLIRKICSACKEQVSVAPAILQGLGIPAAEAATLKVFKGKGCTECGSAGYRGRIGIYETMPVKRELREAIVGGSPTNELRKIARAAGLITLREGALLKLRHGLTTVDEVLRVTAGER